MRAYWAFNLLGALSAVLLFVRTARRNLLQPVVILDAILAAFPLGLIFGRLFSIVLEDSEVLRGLKSMLSLGGWQTGYISFGAVFGSVAALFLVARVHHVAFGLLMDVAAPGIFIAAALGRIGCFLNGCCYGRPTDFTWLTMKLNVVAGTTAPVVRHPVQLYEAGLLLAGWVLVGRLAGRGWFYVGLGRTALVTVGAYCTIRFVTDWFRATETSPTLMPGLSFTKLLSAMVAFTVIVLLVRCKGTSAASSAVIGSLNEELSDTS